MKICPVCSREFAAGETHCPDDGVALVALSSAEKSRPEGLIGQIVEGRYRVERIVGKGGMGTVYAARHVVVGKTVALKVLRPSVDQTEGVLQRFVREAQTTNLLKSRHIVEISDFGQLPNGLFFVVMELLEGQDLTRAMKPGQLTRPELIHIFIQIAEALGAAHDLGVVHRDLKPDNVFLVNEAGDPHFVKLLDFGIAKLLNNNNSGLTETGVILGTPYYMSPEQARAEAIDARTDIYALGVMMYRAFTGRLPFVADSTMGVLTRHLSEVPEKPSKVSSVYPKAEALILLCMEKRPQDRPQSMREVARDLRAMLLEEEQRSGRRRVRDDPTVSAQGVGAIPSPPAFPSAPTFSSAQAAVDPRAASGQHPSGAYPGVPHQTGPHPSGAYAGAPHQTGPHLSGAYSGVPHQTGPHPSGAFAGRATPISGYPSGAHPQVAPSSEPSVTSLHWPPGNTGGTTRGFATSSLPAATPRRGLVVALGALVMIASGAIAAAVFFGSRSQPVAPIAATNASASTAQGATSASAAASDSAASASTPPPSASATAAAPSASPVAVAPVRPRGGGAQTPPPPPPPPPPPTSTPTAKPSATAPPKRPGVEIRSPFD